MERDSVKLERKWDLRSLIKDNEEYEQLFAQVKQGIEKLKKWEGKLTPDNALECLKSQSNTSRILEKIYTFTLLQLDENVANSKNQRLAERVKMLAVEFYQASSFIDTELAAFSEKELQAMRSDPLFSNFDRALLKIIRSKKHILSAKEEKIMASLQSFSGEFKNIFSMFNNVDIKFEDVVDTDGNIVKMSHGNFSMLLHYASQRVRQDAFISNYKAFEGVISTLSATYAGNVKKNCMIAKVRNYSSAMEMSLFDEAIDPKVYDNLIENVRANLPKLHEYIGIRKKLLGLSEFHQYDLYVPIVQEIEIALEYEDAFALVQSALLPLGQGYRKVLKKAYSERWIDVEETKNKRSGAYSWSCYDAHPFILLNYKKIPADIFTIAHELGHAMHSYYSNANQCYEKATYEIFLAEIASTVNEVLVLKYLMRDASPLLKKFLLAYYVDMFRSTVFRQTQFAEFEKFAHQSNEAGEPLTMEMLCEFYYKLNREYYGRTPIYDEYIKYEWARIPHFYNAFYVYKYATGLISAVSIAKGLLTDKSGKKREQYLKFLSSGGSQDPLDILKIVGIDLLDNKVFEDAFAELATTLSQLKEEL